MTVIPASYEILTPLSADSYKLIEAAGRTCYKSEAKTTEISAAPFVHKLCNVLKHESVLEHSFLAVRFIVDRGVSHEIVRHRIGFGFSQESTRYVNYGDRGFTVIKPCFWDDESEAYQVWKLAMLTAERSYRELLDLGASPQQARSVLPNSTKTELVMSGNFRAWRNMLGLRTADNAHPQMREVMVPLAEELKSKLPEVFTL